MSEPKGFGVWQLRLQATFSENGVFTPRLQRLAEFERRHREQSENTLRGYVDLMDSFLEFFAETLVAQDDAYKTHTLAAAVGVACFWRFRAADNLFWSGYYTEAGALLRGIWENAQYLAAKAGGAIRFEELWEIGADALTMKPKAQKRMRRDRRKDLERKTREWMTSGVDASVLAVLERSTEILHLHVHRAEVSILNVTTELIASGRVSLFPVFDLHRSTMIANVAPFIAWGILRHFPSFADVGLSDVWQSRYHTLDAAFRAFHETKEPANIAELHRAFVVMIESKFNASAFPAAQGK